MPTGAEELAAAKAALAVIQIAQKQGWFNNLLDFLKTKHFVLLLGSTGVGKSNFVLSLQSLIPKAISHMDRTGPQAKRPTVKLGGSIFEFVDTPGEDGHKSFRVQAILDIQSKDRYGIINVVSYGYHEYKTGRTEAILDTKPKDEWLTKHRKIEIKAVEGWSQSIGAKPPKFLITLATKADLWWSQRDEVLKYYESGEYAEAIKAAGINSHSVLPYSSVYHQFYNLGVMDGTFEARDRQECMEKFVETLFMVTAK